MFSRNQSHIAEPFRVICCTKRAPAGVNSISFSRPELGCSVMVSKLISADASARIAFDMALLLMSYQLVSCFSTYFLGMDRPSKPSDRIIHKTAIWCRSSVSSVRSVSCTFMPTT